MKKTQSLKYFVNLLYAIYYSGFIGILLIPFILYIHFYQEELNIKNINMDFAHWSVLLTGIITYILFFRGLFYLKKVASALLLNDLFSSKVVINLNRSGKNFIFTGILYLSSLLILWIGNISKGKISLSYNILTLIPFLLIIFGLFFIIQSNALEMARDIKNENDLTI